MPYDTKIQSEFEAEMNVSPSYYFECMGDPAMELGEKELEKIGRYVKTHLAEWIGEVRRERELDLVERVVRVEEELKSLREVMETRFESFEKRFSQILWTMGIGFTLLAALMGVFNFF